MRTIAVAFAFACVLAAPVGAFIDSGSGSPEPVERPPAVEPFAWRDSVAVVTPSAGRLVRGVRLPPERAGFFTWDPVERRRPNRAWRRWGTDRLVRIVLRVVRKFSADHPGAPRVGIGDLSRPPGGSFGP